MKQHGCLVEDQSGIYNILANCRTIALCGASDKVDRPSYQVMAALLHWGYQVYPVNPRLAGRVILGRPVVAGLGDIDVGIDLVDLFINSQRVGPLVEEAIGLGRPVIWMQQGVINPDAAQQAIAAGCQVVMDRCPKLDIPALAVPTPNSVPAM